jgi:hypothetical protein
LEIDVLEKDVFLGLMSKGKDILLSSVQRNLTIHSLDGHIASGYHQQYVLNPYQGG